MYYLAIPNLSAPGDRGEDDHILCLSLAANEIVTFVLLALLFLLVYLKQVTDFHSFSVQKFQLSVLVYKIYIHASAFINYYSHTQFNNIYIYLFNTYKISSARYICSLTHLKQKKRNYTRIIINRSINKNK